MKVLLTFTGFHDPFSEGLISAEREAGPVLTVTSERNFDSVFLFTTPSTSDITLETQKQLAIRLPACKVEICDVPLKDPTNYLGILKHLRTHFRAINKSYREADFFICVSSGTPHMHASWLMLAASGEIPARILQTRARRFVREGESQVTEIDFTNPQFPQIKPFGVLPDTNTDSDLDAIRGELNLVGDDDVFLTEVRKAYILASYDSPVLLLGETGVGKELFARLIHRASKRASRPMVTTNCAAFTESLIASQLFGHRKGAFTGADRDQRGIFEEADGGTLFLDELGEMPPQCQAKLLRAVQHGRIQRLGESTDRPVNVRVIAATNLDIKKAIQDKALRQDLYYRFQSTVQIPSLRNRRSDIPKLAHRFMEEWNRGHQRQRRFSQEAILALMRRPWPGNIRELEGVVIRSAQLCAEKVIGPEHLLFDDALETSTDDGLPDPEEGFDLNSFLSRARETVIDRALRKCDGNQSRAAALLGLTPQAVSQFLRGRK
ncbi:MAG: sigma 54-interacting transcriptional regulator [Verrucomicrobia bacterium]|nr:sigma 54-interacting transcriptional regulator [Verrucomicrobiota bacterium]